jgi:cobalt-zinc-cadmium efflux system outer membrane protein
MPRIYAFLTLLLALAQAPHMPGAAPERAVDTLVKEVLAKNPEIAFYEAEIAAARAGRSVAGRLSNPELSLEIGRKRVSSGNGTSEGLAYATSIVQPIEWPGRLGLRKAIANRDIALAELGLERFKFHLASKVRTLAYTLAANQDVSKAANEVADRYKDLKDVMVQREPAGIAPQLELKTIEAAAVVSQSKAAKADIEVQKALLELNQLMGLRADSTLTVVRPAFTLGELPSSEKLLRTAAENNYELRIRRSELEQQGFKVALAENERYPTFTVGPYVSQERADERETVVGLSLSVPLPVWNDGKANVTTAQARQIQAQATLNAAQREMEKQVMEAVLLFRSHQKRLSLWKDDGIAKFSEAASLADRHYRLGAVPITTYVELQDKYLEAVEAINEAQAEALEAALTLEELTGTPASLVRPAKQKAE